MVVIDASIAFKWFNEKEVDFDKAFNLYLKHLHKEELILAPDLIIYELCNAWSTKPELKIPQIKLNLKNFQGINIKLETLSFTLAEKALAFSKKYNTTFYDSVYAVLAQEKGCDLITADAKFTSQVNLPFIKDLVDYS